MTFPIILWNVCHVSEMCVYIAGFFYIQVGAISAIMFPCLESCSLTD